MDIIETISKEFLIKPEFIQSILNLHKEGSTIPFMTRYRREKIGISNEFMVKKILAYYDELESLQKKQKQLIKKFTEATEITPEIKKHIQNTKNEYELEEIEQAFQPRTKSPQIALVRTALKPLVEKILKQEDFKSPLETIANDYINETAGLTSTEKVIDGLKKIITEELLRTLALKSDIKKIYWANAIFQSSKADSSPVNKKYSEYENFSKPAKDLNTHQFLQIQAGTRQKNLKFLVTADDSSILTQLFEKRIKITEPTIKFLLESIYTDVYHNHLKQNLDAFVIKKLWKRAENSTIETASQTLQNYLMLPGFGNKSLFAFTYQPKDKKALMVSLDSHGDYLGHYSLDFTEDKNKESIETLNNLVKTNSPQIMVLAKQEGTRELWDFLKNEFKNIPVVILESTLSEIIAKTKSATQEFENNELRLAVCLGRYLQNPLNQTIKLSPLSLPLNPHQRTINKELITKELDLVLKSCVNRLGVDLNHATESLLEHVSGLDKNAAKKIIEHRTQNGPFKSKQDLLTVEGLTPKHYFLASGFLIISNAQNLLDKTFVHPEHYELAQKMADQLNKSIQDLFDNPELLRELNLKELESKDIGLETLRFIINEIRSPAKDPRPSYEILEPSFNIKSIDDLKTGITLKGRVMNIASFGAFVDIGVDELALLHKSAMTETRGKTPPPTVKIGRVLTFHVCDVDKNKKRIQVDFTRPARKSEPRRDSQHKKFSSDNHRDKRSFNKKTDTRNRPPQKRDRRSGPPRNQLGTLGDQFKDLFKN